ncbi:glycosyltransferase [Paenibacillus sp. 3LSP]|uniref:tetratricopeptide repeat-containing glycosyltransferase family 2 protein n=1 Tax=Paenibacillus sp. 3LSP TaxID=2800795 RepID=UPI0028FD5A0E|nr:glycosyltransferase [Paenibacillus sp. 3LSP]MDU0331703.1 glycosyltransferase [Paenibacillus sp. 3LSP]
MNNLISLCMIVKDEEKVISRCLDSVQGLVDEIIIIDTGSVDNTKTIARKYTKHVYDFKWGNDFSAARNESLRYATAKWILVLDADEYINSSDIEGLRNALRLTTTDKDSLKSFMLPIHNFTGRTVDPSRIMISQGARIFENHKGMYYSSPIHEQLTSDHYKITFQNLPYPVYHDGYTEIRVKGHNKSERNLSILESMKTEEKLQDPYFCFILGNAYISDNQLEKAGQLYRACLASSTPNHSWYIHLLDNLISTELKLENYVEAYQLIQQAIQQYPGISDYYCHLGLLYDQFGMFQQAIGYFEQALKCAETAVRQNRPYWNVQPSYGSTVPLQMLLKLHNQLGHKTDAVRYGVQLLQIQPRNYTVLQQVWELLIQAEQDNEAIIRLFQTVYPNASAIEYIALFLVALRTGSRSLSSYYYQKLTIQVSPSDALTYHLLQHEEKPFKLSIDMELDASPALIAAVVYNDPNYLSAITDTEGCESARELWTYHCDLQANPNSSPQLTDSASDLLAKTLLILLSYSYNDIYLHWLQSMATADTINKLADLMYEHGYYEPAIELYAILLDNGVLSPKSMINIGQWQLVGNNADDGYLFIDTAFDHEKDLSVIGWVFNYCSKKQYEQFLERYLDAFPHLIELPFLTQPTNKL